ncbi:hypothetical protein EWM64_g665 [Hericium alpestre]|uniref:Uncharacterized protein n=1 Tax=Hericium alpestre TaxID=135208 RepID=A0A4Z0AAR9_9AGAM|nr:hypothetical protein EWM64_g665 [Hericium alpestre]
MPFIEELMLHNATPLFPMDSAVIAAPERVVTLPHLQSLDLSTEAIRLAHVLNYLNLPNLRKIHADCTSTFESAADVLAILPLFSKHCHGAHDAGPLKSLIFAGGRNMVKIIAFNEPNRDHPIDNPIALLAAVFTSRITLTVTATQTGWEFGAEEKIFESTAMTLPIKDVESFTAQDVERAFFLSWRKCMPWRNLRRFTLVGGYLFTVADSLLKNTLDESDKMQIQPSPEDEESLSGLLFPQLTTLALVETDLLEYDLSMMFCDFIVARSELGLPIQELVILRCEVDIDMLDRFRGLVPTITWDGIERPFTDGEIDAFMGGDGLDNSDEEDDDDDMPEFGGNNHLNIPDPLISMLLHGYGLGSPPPAL